MLVIAVAALAVLSPQIRSWLTSYEGVVLRTDTETVKYSRKKGPEGRQARVYKVEVGTAEGEPFWATVERELYQELKIGSFVRKGYFREAPEKVPGLEGFAALRARYSWIEAKQDPGPGKAAPAAAPDEAPEADLEPDEEGDAP